MYAAVCCIGRNPVRAGLVKKAEEYKWSSAGALVYHEHDTLLSDPFFNTRNERLGFILIGTCRFSIMKHAGIGRPLGERIIII